MKLATTSIPTTTTPDLTTRGFSLEEIAHLTAIKAKHDPYREYCESNREYERLVFLKWRIEHGQIGWNRIPSPP